MMTFNVAVPTYPHYYQPGRQLLFLLPTSISFHFPSVINVTVAPFSYYHHPRRWPLPLLLSTSLIQISFSFPNIIKVAVPSYLANILIIVLPIFY